MPRSGVINHYKNYCYYYYYPYVCVTTKKYVGARILCILQYTRDVRVCMGMNMYKCALYSKPENQHLNINSSA